MRVRDGTPALFHRCAIGGGRDRKRARCHFSARRRGRTGGGHQAESQSGSVDAQREPSFAITQFTYFGVSETDRIACWAFFPAGFIRASLIGTLAAALAREHRTHASFPDSAYGPRNVAASSAEAFRSLPFVHHLSPDLDRPESAATPPRRPHYSPRATIKSNC
jgi:hypothetical protein